MIDRVEERCRLELNRLSHFQALGLQPHLAVRAVDDGIDWHDLEALLCAAANSNSQSKS